MSLRSTFCSKKSLGALTFIAFLVLLICGYLVYLKKNHSIGHFISHLSQKEQMELKLFFHNLFISNELGYTLFGDKPMSFCFPDAIKPQFSQRDFTYKIYFDGDLPLFRGLAVWKKIKNTIKNEKYSLILYEDHGYPTFAILINKQAFITEVNKNIKAFQKVYGKSIKAEEILKKIEDKVINQDELFSQHLLLGIMLGYGRHSAALFQRRWSLAYGDLKPPLLSKSVNPSPGFSSIREELEYITNRLQTESKDLEWYTNTFPLFLRVTTVAFAFDPDDPEAQSLIKKYKALHMRLTDIFDRADWLELVLAQLAS